MFTFLAVAVCFLTGCAKSDRPQDLPKLTPCTLTIVSQDGTPVADAQVQLWTDQGIGAKWTAGGLADAEGKLVPMVQGKWSGVVPGTYKVLVKKFQVVKEKEVDNPETGQKMVLQKNIPLIDPSFGKPDQTPLSLTVGTTGAVDEKLTVKLLKK